MILTLPRALMVTAPAAVTVAFSGSEEDQVTALLVAPLTLAWTRRTSPIWQVAEPSAMTTSTVLMTTGSTEEELSEDAAEESEEAGEESEEAAEESEEAAEESDEEVGTTEDSLEGVGVGDDD